MSTDALFALRERLGDGAVTTEPEGRAAAAIDWWALGLLRLARGEAPAVPDAVILPSSTGDVAVVMRWASETRTAVVPRGGGSGVCGAARAGPGSVVLDLSRMVRVLDVDDVSRAVRVEAGIRGDALETALESYGLTVGHYPQSIALSSVGGWIAAASAGQASAAFGSIEDVLLGLTAVLPDGSVLRLPAVPRSAMGPDLRRLLIGSEGAFGVVTEATLACSAAPRRIVWHGLGFDSFRAAIDAVRRVAQSDVRPFVVRAYDEADAALAFGRMGHPGGPVAIVGFDPDAPGATDRQRASVSAAVQAGGAPLPDGYGEHWWEHRNDAVRTYQRVMGPERMFGPGVVVDTLEVAGLWRDVPILYAAIRAALLDHAEAVGCHVSHPYGSGASLYFTFLVRGADDVAVEGPYLAAWEAAAHACLASRGTVSHHHGVGALKAPFVEAELGPEGAAVLARLRTALDPMGLLRPPQQRP